MDEERKNLTYREYAEAEHISYEAVRKKIERHKNDPELRRGIITDKKNTKLLTPEAQDYLSEKGRKYMLQKDPETLKQLEKVNAENEILRQKVIELQSALSVYERLQIGTSVPQEEHQKLAERVDALSTDLSAKNAEIKALQQKLDEVVEEIKKPRKRGIFGRFRGE